MTVFSSDGDQFLHRMRYYMPPKHRAFIEAVSNGPSIRNFGEWVMAKYERSYIWIFIINIHWRLVSQRHVSGVCHNIKHPVNLRVLVRYLKKKRSPVVSTFPMCSQVKQLKNKMFICLFHWLISFYSCFLDKFVSFILTVACVGLWMLY